jgi:hypothetical protein
VLSYACPGVQKSFDKVLVIDNRIENNILGFVNRGMFNRIEPVVFNGTLPVSLAKFFKSKDTLNNKGRELIILLNDLYVSEKREFSNETGRLKITMRLFYKTGYDQYVKIQTVDSSYLVSAIDVTDKLLKSVSLQLCAISKQVSEFILSDSLNSTGYTLNDLHHLDSLEKLEIPIYITSVPRTGIYRNFYQFKMNDPEPATISIDQSNPDKIKAYFWDSIKQKKIKIEKDSVYAIFDGTTLLKATSIGFYKLYKSGMDYYYFGQTSFTVSKDPEIMWGLMFGLIGSSIAYALDKDDQLYKFKINHLKGNSIPVSVLKK